MQLVGISFPRSGHHFLVRLLASVLPDSFSHCEFYGPVGCCRTIPCLRPGKRVHFQKNHDFELDVPTDLKDCLYVIQHREPVGAAVSDREFYVRVEGDAVGASRADYEVWLGRQAAHFVGFYRRWLASPPVNSVCIDYADLSADAPGTVRRLLAAAGIEVDTNTLQAAAEALATIGDFGVDGYTVRQLEERPGFDRELLAQYESLIVDELPERAAPRLLARVERNVDSAVEIAFAAAIAEQSHSPEQALAHLERGLVLFPRHPLLLHWRGRIAWRAGDLAAARAYCDAAVELFGEHPLLRVEVAQIAYAQRDLAAARAHAEALLALRESDPGHEVLLAMILADLLERDAAKAQISRAWLRRPTEPSHWALLVRAALRVDLPDEARGLVSEARAIWPGHTELSDAALGIAS